MLFRLDGFGKNTVVFFKVWKLSGFVRGVVIFVYSKITGEAEYRTACMENVTRIDDVSVYRVKCSGFHLACDKSAPDELVELILIVGKVALDSIGMEVYS